MARSNLFLQYSPLILLLSAFTSALPNFQPDQDALVLRQYNNAARAVVTAAPALITAAATVGKTNSTKATITAKTSYDARLPAGGITMLTPAPTSGSQYYKVGDHVTFAWNYTSLSAIPTALNIMASCASQNLYTLATNQTILPNIAGSYTWDTNPSLYSATPLIQATCTLIIYDADSTISAAPQAGYLQVFNSFQFGIYFPQTPTDSESLNGEIKCATCSGAVAAVEAKAFSFMLGMAAITVLSFTWFVGGLGIIW